MRRWESHGNDSGTGGARCLLGKSSIVGAISSSTPSRVLNIGGTAQNLGHARGVSETIDQFALHKCLHALLPPSPPSCRATLDFLRPP